MEQNNMTNKECAEEMKRLLVSFVTAAGQKNAKSPRVLRTVEAFTRSIELLEAAPDNIERD